MNLTVLIAGLGYFVDLFDITLYGVVRVASLTDLGLNEAQVMDSGVFIYSCQMAGLMVGGLLFGVLSDKRGRLSVMFGSILLYSFANIANAFAWDVTSYAVFRFIGGVGLAGELGAAVTLVAESLPKEKRGLGTTIVATLGMLGIIAAAGMGKLIPAGIISWRTAYLIGGVMGLALLAARFKMSESDIFKKGHSANANPLLIFRRGRFFRYICCILIGTPVYFVTGALMTFAPELTKGLGLKATVTAGDAILVGSLGLALGDMLAGLLSQSLKSRRKALAVNLIAGLLLTFVYGFSTGINATTVYILTFLLGTSVGYWAMLVTTSAEQFGTNIRGTVATTVPNFVRGSAIIPVNLVNTLKLHMPLNISAVVVGTLCFGIALLALLGIQETFNRDLDYEET